MVGYDRVEYDILLLPGKVLFSGLLAALCLRDKASVHDTYDQGDEFLAVSGVDDLHRMDSRRIHR